VVWFSGHNADRVATICARSRLSVRPPCVRQK